MQTGKNTWYLLAIILILNFVLWSFVHAFIGGNAVSGRHIGDQYFVKGRKGEKAISKQIYYYSLFHTYFTYAGGPICMFALLKGIEKHRKK
jgi:hypothetical protein